MSGEVPKLAVVPDDVRKCAERREQVIEILRRALLKAEAGGTLVIMVVEGEASGHWEWHTSGMANRFEAIGHLEQLKHELMCGDD